MPPSDFGGSPPTGKVMCRRKLSSVREMVPFPTNSVPSFVLTVPLTGNLAPIFLMPSANCFAVIDSLIFTKGGELRVARNCERDSPKNDVFRPLRTTFHLHVLQP